jgi:two-component system response regulator GlrR
VFLDEIGELPIDMQPKLLRVIEAGEVRRIGENQTRQVNVRVIAATNRNLEREVNNARFREDLFFRLSVITLRVPPLRERPEDLAVLVERITMQLGVGHEVGRRLTSPGFVAALAGGAWPGNVRELRNYIERAAVIDDLVGVEEEAVPEAETDPQPYQQARDRVLAEFERRVRRAAPACPPRQRVGGRASVGNRSDLLASPDAAPRPAVTRRNRTASRRAIHVAAPRGMRYKRGMFGRMLSLVACPGPR